MSESEPKKTSKFIIVAWILVPYIMAPIYLLNNYDGIFTKKNGETRLRFGLGAAWAVTVIIIGLTSGGGGDRVGTPQNDRPRATARTPQANAKAITQKPDLSTSSDFFVVRVKVFEREGKVSWDASGKPDIAGAVFVNNEQHTLAVVKDREIAEYRLPGALKAGDRISIKVVDKDISNDDDIGSAALVLDGPKYMVRVGFAVVQLLAKDQMEQNSMAEFGSAADQVFDDSYSAESEKQVEALRSDITKKSWYDAAQRAKWFEDNPPRRGATHLVEEVDGLVAKAEAEIEKIKEKEAAAERKAKLMASKSRLGKRKFKKISSDRLVEGLIAAPSMDELWETKYQGKYVRWNAKFVRSGMMLVKFLADTGSISGLQCKDFDDAFDEAVIEDIKRWDKIVVEGRLSAYGTRLGEKTRLDFMLRECIVKRR